MRFSVGFRGLSASPRSGYGLGLPIRPDGASYWRMDYQHAGKRESLALVRRPEISLNESREGQTPARECRPWLLSKSSSSRHAGEGASAP